MEALKVAEILLEPRTRAVGLAPQFPRQRLAVVDDHAIMRGVFVTLVEDSPDLAMAWAAPCLEEARQKLQEDRPDFLIMDVTLPDGNGLDFLPDVLRAAPGLPVLMVSAQDDEEIPRIAAERGARGFLRKESSLDMLLDAIGTIQQGGRWFSHEG